MIKIIIWAVVGGLVGYLVNQLADFFAEVVAEQKAIVDAEESEDGAVTPEIEAIKFRLGKSGIFQFIDGERGRKRPPVLELICILLFATLPVLIPNNINLIINSFHIAILILIMIVDLENKAVFGIIIYPAVVIALIGSFFVTPEENNIRLALVGAIVGFLVFWVFYKLAQMIYGAESGALGFGDVQIALLMGAMLGLHRVVFALILAIILGGVMSAIVLLLSRNVGRRTALPYGQYLTIAAIIMLIWGAAYYDFYWS